MATLRKLDIVIRMKLNCTFFVSLQVLKMFFGIINSYGKPCRKRVLPYAVTIVIIHFICLLETQNFDVFQWSICLKQTNSPCPQTTKNVNNGMHSTALIILEKLLRTNLSFIHFVRFRPKQEKNIYFHPWEACKNTLTIAIDNMHFNFYKRFSARISNRVWI